MNAAIFDLVSNAPAREIMMGLRQIFATHEKEPVSLALVLRIVAVRMTLCQKLDCGREPNMTFEEEYGISIEKTFANGQLRVQDASLIPNITRLFIQNSMPIDGVQAVLEEIEDSPKFGDGPECDYIDAVYVLLDRPYLAMRNFTVEQANRVFLEFCEMMSGLSRKDFHAVAFVDDDGTQTRNEICMLARYGSIMINHHSDKDELDSLHGEAQ